MPIGFKNGTDGNVQIAVDAVRAAAASHSFTGIDPSGTPAILRTAGNRDGHVILRGGRDSYNYRAPEVAEALAQFERARARERESSSTHRTTTRTRTRIASARSPPTSRAR